MTCVYFVFFVRILSIEKRYTIFPSRCFHFHGKRKTVMLRNTKWWNVVSYKKRKEERNQRGESERWWNKEKVHNCSSRGKGVQNVIDRRDRVTSLIILNVCRLWSNRTLSRAAFAITTDGSDTSASFFKFYTLRFRTLYVWCTFRGRTRPRMHDTSNG